MNHQLTCDEVFDRLTRAPFPAGEETDQCVEGHLRVCHDCRQLAEALRPATDLFREVLSDDQRQRLPAYRGQLASELGASTRTLTMASARTKSTIWKPVVVGRESRRQPRYFLPALGLAMLLMVAMLDGRGIVGDRTSGNPAAANASAGSDQPMTCRLAGLALSPACLPTTIVGPTRPKPIDPPAHSINDDGHLLIACLSCHESVQAPAAKVCCTNCHAANQPLLTGTSVFPQLATSCARCHQVDAQQPAARASI